MRIKKLFLQSKQAKTNWALIAVLVAAVALVTGIVKVSTSGVSFNGLNFGGNAPSESQAPSTSAALPLNFILTDPLAGSGIASATVAVYTTNNALKESLTTGSGGVIATSQVWTPGQIGYVKISKSTYVSETVPFTVPSTVTIGTYAAQVYSIPLSDNVIGTYSIKCFDNLGNQYTNGTAGNNYINFTALGVTSVTLSFTIYDTVVNTGYVSTYDNLYNVNQNAGIAVSTTGSSVSLPGGIGSLTGAQTFSRGTTLYWSAIVPDSQLTNQKVGNNIVLPGQASYSITINKGALSASTQNFTSTLVAPFDSNYYQTNGVGGPNAATLATYNWCMVST